MSRSAWFLAGMLVTIGIEASFVSGVAWGIPEPTPVVQNVNVERHMTFKVLAPKGFEEVGYIDLDCKPNMRKTYFKNGMKSNAPWARKVASEPLPTVEVKG